MKFTTSIFLINKPSSGLSISSIAYFKNICVKISMALAFKSVFSSFKSGYFEVELYALGRTVKTSPVLKFSSARVVPFSLSLIVLF